MTKPLPTLASLNILGLILRCPQCDRKRVKEIGELPMHETVPGFAQKGRCRHCGYKGADVEVLNRIVVSGAAYGTDISAKEIEHLEKLKAFYHC